MKVLTEARRAAIVQAASQLFQEFGYEGASMNELATRLRGSKATLYRYFPSKEALFDAVVRASSTSHLSQAVEDLQSHTEASEHTQIRAALQQFGETMLKVMVDSTQALAVYRMVVAEAMTTPELAEAFYEAGPLRTRQELVRFFSRPEIRAQLKDGVPLETLAIHLTCCLLGDSMSRMLFPSDQAPPAAQLRLQAERGLDMFLSGALR